MEVPQAIEQRVEKRNYHITDTELGIGTPTEKYQNNITAIRLLKELESENRLATAEEQAVLAKYGGLGRSCGVLFRNKQELRRIKKPADRRRIFFRKGKHADCLLHATYGYQSNLSGAFSNGL